MTLTEGSTTLGEVFLSFQELLVHKATRDVFSQSKHRLSAHLGTVVCTILFTDHSLPCSPTMLGTSFFSQCQSSWCLNRTHSLFSDTSRRVGKPCPPITRQLNEQWSPLLQSLSAQNFKLLLTNANGMVVEEWGGGEFAEQAKKVRLIRGSMWGEGIRGTNAIGTAIAEKRPVAVHGSAHYQRQNHELVCYAAPFCDTKGDLLGVLDATSFAKAAHPSVIMSVMTDARAIEEWLRLRQPVQELVLPTMVERLLQSHPGPAMLVEPSGQIRLANAKALASFAPLNTTALPLTDSLFKVQQSIQSLLGVSEQILFDPASHEKAVRLGPSLQFCLEVESVFSHSDSPIFSVN